MDSITSVDTSIYSGLIDSVYTMPSKESYSKPVEAVEEEMPNGYESVDLSRYYSNVTPEDLLSQVGENVVKSAHDLDAALVSALQNGLTVNDICNIKSAQAAYKANCYVLKSTFELQI